MANSDELFALKRKIILISMSQFSDTMPMPIQFNENVNQIHRSASTQFGLYVFVHETYMDKLYDLLDIDEKKRT